MSTASDFDFFHGHWQVSHRRLQRRLAGCTDWDSFTGSCRTWPLLGGAGNVDDNELELPSGRYRAATLRSFDAASGEWAIWWLDGRHPHQLDLPMRGGFSDGVGRFYADDHFEGRAIRVRFLWTLPATDAPRWEQAFSLDGGETWETNWVMDFKRLA